jgi:purine-binding chemotaxis protein CheW
VVSRQMACFRVGGRECAVDVLRISEVLRPVPITPLPAAPRFVEGLIELRGRFLPVVDLRKRFDADAPAAGDRSKYIVAPLHGTSVALVVDDVSGVERIPADLIQPPPNLAEGRIAPAFVSGVVRWNERVLMVVDLDALLTEAERGELGRM